MKTWCQKDLPTLYQRRSRIIGSFEKKGGRVEKSGIKLWCLGNDFWVKKQGVSHIHKTIELDKSAVQ